MQQPRWMRTHRMRNAMWVARLTELVLLDTVVGTPATLLPRIVLIGLQLRQNALVFVLNMFDLALELFELLLQVVDAHVLIDRFLAGLRSNFRNGILAWLARSHCFLSTVAIQQLLKSDFTTGARLWYEVATASRFPLHGYSLF